MFLIYLPRKKRWLMRIQTSVSTHQKNWKTWSERSRMLTVIFVQMSTSEQSNTSSNNNCKTRFKMWRRRLALRRWPSQRRWQRQWRQLPLTRRWRPTRDQHYKTFLPKLKVTNRKILICDLGQVLQPQLSHLKCVNKVYDHRFTERGDSWTIHEICWVWFMGTCALFKKT